MEELSNGIIEVGVSLTGAELQSLKKVKSEKEYIWNANPAFWDRHAPLLFPIVGNVWNKTFRMDGVAYLMEKHGFARDQQFQVVSRDRDILHLCQESTDETLRLYPRSYRLEVIYCICRNKLTVTWRITNTDDNPMWFHIGAHPGFSYPAYKETDDVHGYFSFNEQKKLVSNTIAPGGYLGEDTFDVPLTEGLLPLANHTFDCDTLLDTRGLINRVTLHDKNKAPYLTVRFNMPVLALWSPCGGQAPFVCIEPWCGCCDSTGYEGEFRDRAFVNELLPGAVFENSYDIIVE
ncbi:MAG: aldose 1-epimerase family protein [Clostridium sp.]|nr:aldose 1-epimerase family protein [Clostridium sp.]